jgi:probable addiction module antidote protein
MSKETYTPWDSAEFLNDDEAVVEYLQAALEENDPAFFVKAIGNVARAKGMTRVAQKTRLGRQNLYRALSGERNPRIGTLMKVLDSLGVQLTVAPSRCEDAKTEELALRR